TAMPSSSSVPFTARKNAPENSSQKWSSLKGSDHVGKDEARNPVRGDLSDERFSFKIGNH
ncbi:hypothetical protein, partial [Agrobacterium cavarae]